MSDVGDGTLFEFSAIAQTEVMKLSGEFQLPYNPFSFDLVLRIIKSKQSFENQIQFKIQSGCKSIFGRKKVDVQYILKAPTISSRHFMIDETKKIVDLGSTTGTFIWVPHSRPANLEQGRIFLIGKTQFIVNNINYDDRQVTLEYIGKKICIKNKQNPFLIGSHKTCNLQVQGLNEFHAAIDVYTMKIHNFAEDEDCSNEVGVWERLSPSKKQSVGRSLEADDIIMAIPYIFSVQY